VPRHVVTVPLRVQAAASDTVARLTIPAIDSETKVSFMDFSFVVVAGQLCHRRLTAWELPSQPFFARAFQESPDL